MNQYWISFRSLTHAQRAARVLERKAYTATLTRLPQGLSPKGCGYAVVVRHRPSDVIRILHDGKIPFGMVFVKDENGQFREVTL